MEEEPDWVQSFQATPASPSNSSGSDVVFTRQIGKSSAARRSPSSGSPSPTPPAERPETDDSERDGGGRGESFPSLKPASPAEKRLSKSPGSKGLKENGKSPGKKSPGKKSPAKKQAAAQGGSDEEPELDHDGHAGDDDGPKRPGAHKPKPTGLGHVSEMPLLLPDRVDTGKVLVEVKDPEGALDLSGDAGAVGRMRVEKQSEGAPDKIFVDLKGMLYLAEIVPSTSFLVVSLGQAEAKVESVASDFLRLKEEGNIFQAEMMEGGNLADVFGDDDDDDGGWVPAGTGDADEGGDGAPKKKRQKKAEEGAPGKASTAPKKKATKPRGAGGKPRARGGGKAGARGGGARKK